MNKIISIITVVYNGERYIERTIKSIIGQKSEEVEYIIIDGGSTDSTNNIVSKYRGYVDFYKSERDDGIFDAMNKGSRLANGSYLWFINSDDYICDGIISHIIGYIKNTTDLPDIIYGDIFSENSVGSIFNCPTPSAVSKKMFFNLPIHHPGSLIHKRAFSSLGGFNITYQYSSDFDLFYRLICNNNSFVKLDGNFAVMQEGGTGTQHITKSLNEFYKSLRSNRCQDPIVLVKFLVRYVFLIFKYKIGPISSGVALLHNVYRKLRYGK